MLWTVYNRPTDYPHSFVARRFEVDADGVVATDTVVVSGDPARLRRHLQKMGLVSLHRDESDDPKIVETWL